MLFGQPAFPEGRLAILNGVYQPPPAHTHPPEVIRFMDSLFVGAWHDVSVNPACPSACNAVRKAAQGFRSAQADANGQ